MKAGFAIGEKEPGRCEHSSTILKNEFRWWNVCADGSAVLGPILPGNFNGILQLGAGRRMAETALTVMFGGSQPERPGDGTQACRQAFLPCGCTTCSLVAASLPLWTVGVSWRRPNS